MRRVRVIRDKNQPSMVRIGQPPEVGVVLRHDNMVVFLSVRENIRDVVHSGTQRLYNMLDSIAPGLELALNLASDVLVKEEAPLRPIHATTEG